MSHSCVVLKDSLSDHGVRLTTLEVTFPRFILAEVNTHRMFSRNSASSRAIPTEKMIERVRTNPFVPATFNERVKGMGVGKAMQLEDAEQARAAWIMAAQYAAASAAKLNDIGLDKSRANRLLEPFLWHTAIITATEWDNWFALRDHEAAQPEIRTMAQGMKFVMEMSEPEHVGKTSWHMPLVSVQEVRDWIELMDGRPWNEVGVPSWELAFDYWKLVSAGRCARVSYDTQHNAEDPKQSIARAHMLASSGHWSPFEHVARPFRQSEWESVDAAKDAWLRKADAWRDDGQAMDELEFCGNFRGWVQARKQYPNESNFGKAGV